MVQTFFRRQWPLFQIWIISANMYQLVIQRWTLWISLQWTVRGLNCHAILLNVLPRKRAILHMQYHKIQGNNDNGEILLNMCDIITNKFYCMNNEHSIRFFCKIWKFMHIMHAMQNVRSGVERGKTHKYCKKSKQKYTCNRKRKYKYNFSTLNMPSLVTLSLQVLQ